MSIFNLLGYLNKPKGETVNPNLTVAAYITQFLIDKANSKDPYFYGRQLNEFVSNNSNKYQASGTVDRILRKLRSKGVVDYVVVNRTTSYYLAKPIAVSVPDATGTSA
jgi:hypothetical protein